MDVMVNILGILIIFGLVLITAFYQFSILTWTVLIAAGLILVTAVLPLSLITLFILWMGYVLIAAFVHFNAFRLRHVIAPMLSALQKQMPTISVTEREALEAGHTWWEKELFCD